MGWNPGLFGDYFRFTELGHEWLGEEEVRPGSEEALTFSEVLLCARPALRFTGSIALIWLNHQSHLWYVPLPLLNRWLSE